MIYWYLQDTSRFAAEQAAIDALARDASWLTILTTRLDEKLQLSVDFEIASRGETFAATLRYPSTFPHTPPSVRPADNARWSNHQYSNGELCLEFGPDNWQPEQTGAEMIYSAQRLLDGEAPGPDARPGFVSSRHAMTPGQDLRTEWGRLLVTQGLASAMAEVSAGETQRARFLTKSEDQAIVIVPISFGGDDGKAWVDPEAPPSLPGATVWDGLFFRLPAGENFPNIRPSVALRGWLTANGFAPPEGYEGSGIELVLIGTDDGPRLAWLRAGAENAFDFTVVQAAGGQRLDVGHATVATKTVGIVGCGSAGAKIAVSLARSGVRRFVLIDDDFLLPENLVRHELDWSGMGEHKVDALQRRLGLAAPGVICVVRRHRLGGQEANSGADANLSRLQECDLVVDATANPEVFNLLSSVVHAGGKPLIWLEVFAGGIGGLIARSRPGLDPDPQAVRAKILGWCAEQNVAAPLAVTGYGMDAAESPLIANDADVAAIASHATRYSLDLLMDRSPSAFPSSAYLIGLREGWLFSQPFHTIPLDVGAAADKPQAAPSDPAALAAIIQLFQDRRDNSAAAS